MRLPILLSLPVAALFATSASAAVIIGNLAGRTGANENDGGTPSGIAGQSNLGGYSNKGIGFTMGATDYTIDSLKLRLDGFDILNANDRPTVSIWTNTGTGNGAPGISVGTFTNPGTFFGATATDYVFTPTSPIELTAGTSYFIVVQQLNTYFTGIDNSFRWLNGSPTVTPTGVGATALIFPGSPNPIGAGRFGTTALATGMTGTSSNYNWFQLEGTVVSPIPEPSAFAALAGVAGLGLALTRRRRR